MQVVALSLLQAIRRNSRWALSFYYVYNYQFETQKDLQVSLCLTTLQFLFRAYRDDSKNPIVFFEPCHSSPLSRIFPSHGKSKFISSQTQNSHPSHKAPIPCSICSSYNRYSILNTPLLFTIDLSFPATAPRPANHNLITLRHLWFGSAVNSTSHKYQRPHTPAYQQCPH